MIEGAATKFVLSMGAIALENDVLVSRKAPLASVASPPASDAPLSSNPLASDTPPTSDPSVSDPPPLGDASLSSAPLVSDPAPLADAKLSNGSELGGSVVCRVELALFEGPERGWIKEDGGPGVIVVADEAADGVAGVAGVG